MSQDNSPPGSPPSPLTRRASYAPGQKLTEMFGRSPTAGGGSSAYPGSIAAAAANAHAHQRRRMSISTLGLSGSPNQTSPFGLAAGRPRKESQSSSGGSTAGEESAIDDSADAAGPPVPSSPFSRRLSFGARAMRDARSGSGVGSFSNGRTTSFSASGVASGGIFGGGGYASSSSLLVEEPEEGDENHRCDRHASSSPKGRLSNSFSRRTGEGFNWSDNLRSRAERSASISSPVASGTPAAARFPPKAAQPAEAPIKEIKQPRAPDHFQERILKGDFYMD